MFKKKIMLIWKIVRVLEVSVLYMYIDFHEKNMPQHY